jgi:hypothetical protein
MHFREPSISTCAGSLTTSPNHFIEPTVRSIASRAVEIQRD